MFEAFVDGKRRTVQVISCGSRGLMVEYMKTIAEQLMQQHRPVPYAYFRWISDDWHEREKRTIHGVNYDI